MFARTALLAILVLSFTTSPVAFGQPVEKPGDDKVSLTTPWLPPAAFKENPDDDELTRLLKERYRTAAEEVATVAFHVVQGVGDTSASLQRLSDAESRASRAALELCQTSAQRIAVLQKVLEARKRTEAYCKERYEAGADPAYALPLARYERLEAEIALVRAKREAAEEKK
jgi:hypothetical protein